MPFAIEPGQRVVFTGDSITDTGRRNQHAPLGWGYVRMAVDLIDAKYPAHRLEVINTGISGNTVRNLFTRWTDDVIRYQPHWLSVMIGINDIHRWLHNAADESVSPEEYAELYDAILQRAKEETQAKLIICEPFYMSTDATSDSFRATVIDHLPQYMKTVHAMADKYDARLVRFHAMYQQLLQHHAPDRVCPEPVHPNNSGHLMMAHEWLKTMGW